MRVHYKFQIFLSVAFFMVFHLNLIAQNEFIPKENIWNYEEYDHSEDALPAKLNQAIDPGYIKNQISKYASDTRSDINTFQTTTDLLDSVAYVNDGIEYREYFTYDSEHNRLMWYKKQKPVTATNWENDFRYTSTYDDNKNLITDLKEKWNGSWINYRLSTYIRDDAGNTLISLYQKWDSSLGIWENSSNKTYTYDGNGNKLTSLTEYWDSNTGVWTNYWSATYTYDGIGNILIFSDKDWNSNDGLWINHWRRTSAYDNNGNLLTHLSETWENIAGKWETTGLTTYTYNESGNLLVDLSEQWDTDADIWVNNNRETFTYDNSGNMLTDLSENWDVDSSKWVNDERYTYTYDSSGNLLTEFFEDWRNDTFWKKGPLITYTYDGSGNLLGSILEYWNSNDQIWWESMRRSYAYNSYGNLIHSKSVSWSDSGWVAFRQVVVIINNNYRYEFICEELNAYYNPVTSVDNSRENELNSFSLSQNYPNPFNPSTKINFALPNQSNVKLEIYNMLGEKVKTLVNGVLNAGYHEVSFDANNFSSGIYFYRIIINLINSKGQFVSVKKMILLK